MVGDLWSDKVIAWNPSMTGSGATQSPRVESCILVKHRLTSAQDPGLGPLDKAHTKVAKSIWDFEGALAILLLSRLGFECECRMPPPDDGTM
jgi:hypothetical protein